MSGVPGTAAPTFAGERRLALVIATQTYADPSLRQLRAPARDVEELRGVLADSDVGGFELTAVTDRGAHEIRLAIEDFLVDRRTDDLLLIYLTCHGLVDVRRRLFFAASDTRKDRLAATGVEAQWLLQQLDDCRARRQVVILDCCFSGAFANATKGDVDLGLGDRLHGGGRGRVVLTASRGSEYSFEGEPVAGSQMPASVFTSALVQGIRSGAADVDRDGFISVDDAYEYAFGQLRALGAQQTPQRWLYGAEGDIFLARSPAGPAASPVPESVPVSGQTRPEPPSSARPRRNHRRRWVAVGAAVLAGLVAVVLAVVLARQAPAPLAANEFEEKAPWRLVIRNNNYCAVTLRARGSSDFWRNRYTSGKDASFQMRESGIFRWESDKPECVVVARTGPGELTLPVVVVGGQGDTDAFQAPSSVKVEAQDLNGSTWCEFHLVDSESGDTVDVGKLTRAGQSVVLHAEGRPSVYLANGYCTVRISAG